MKRTDRPEITAYMQERVAKDTDNSKVLDLFCHVAVRTWFGTCIAEPQDQEPGKYPEVFF